MIRLKLARAPQYFFGFVVLIFAGQTGLLRLYAGDWPQILGPHRSGEAMNEPALEPWGRTGPRQVWSVEVGEGFAGPAVSNSIVFAFHRVNGSERAEAWRASSGERVWQRDFPASYRGRVNPDSGPRCVPLVHNGRVFLFGAAGNLYCLDASDGKPIWSRDAYGDFDGREGYFGAGSTPIVSQGKLLVNVGGPRAGLVAFDLETGATVWQLPGEGASYSSPTATTIDGREAVIFVTRLNTVAVDSAGQLLFRFPFGRSRTTVNAATPLVFDERLFISASYGIGAKLTRLRSGAPETIWQNDLAMSSQYTTCVHYDGFLYGVHGREDFNNGELRCIEASTGDIRWQARQVGIAHTILVHDRLLLVGVEGNIWLVEATPAAFRPLAEARLTDSTTRALPALSDGRLFLRDARRLRCFEL